MITTNVFQIENHLAINLDRVEMIVRTQTDVGSRTEIYFHQRENALVLNLDDNWHANLMAVYRSGSSR